MNNESKLGLKIIGAAIVLGIFADILFIDRQAGIGVPIWALLLVGGSLFLIKKEKVDVMGDGKLLVLPMIFFATAFAWRDSDALTALNFLALMTTIGLTAATLRIGQLRVAGIARYMVEGILSGLETAFGSFLLLFNIEWGQFKLGSWSKRLVSIGIGLLIAMPILIIFGALLASADATFSSMLKGIFNINSPDWFRHIPIIMFVSWLLAGLLRKAFLANNPIPATVQLPFEFKLGITEMGIVLGSLNLLFLTFVIVQFKYFFGGAARVANLNGLTYADYARSGFFELVTVTALVLPLLLVAHWLLRKGNKTHEYIFRGLAISLIALLSVIMVSAFQRMRLYQQEYGMTELRLYVTAFMIWMAILFVLFGYTVLRGQRERFAFGALISGLAMVVVLNVINPDAMIVRINAERARNGKQIDADYITSLSADSIPALMEAMPGISEPARQKAANKVIHDWSERGDPGWRSWNWSRSNARKLASENQEMLLVVAKKK